MSSHWLHWKAKSSLWALPVSNQGGVYCTIHLVTFLYIFLLVDCFKWALIDCIEKWRVHSQLWQFQTVGVYCKIHLVTFLYIFLLVDCFKWALIDHKIHLVTFLYIFLLIDCCHMRSHWPHWKAKGSLWALPVSNIRFTWWHFFISFY